MVRSREQQIGRRRTSCIMGQSRSLLAPCLCECTSTSALGGDHASHGIPITRHCLGNSESPKVIRSMSFGNSVDFKVRRHGVPNLDSTIQLEHFDLRVMDWLAVGIGLLPSRGSGQPYVQVDHNTLLFAHKQNVSVVLILHSRFARAGPQGRDRRVEIGSFETVLYLSIGVCVTFVFTPQLNNWRGGTAIGTAQSSQLVVLLQDSVLVGLEVGDGGCRVNAVK